jgi:hypothetical protein
MNDGQASNGAQILSPASAKLMQTAQYQLAGTDTAAMGLGWVLDEWSGKKILWHNGGTLGQLSFLWVVPEKRAAVCILTNAEGGPLLADELSRELFKERFKIKRPEMPRVPKEPVKLDLRKYAGKYKRLGVTLDVEVLDDKLKVTMQTASLFGEERPPPQIFPVTALDKERFAMVNGEGKVQGLINFQGFDRAGRPEYISVGRLARRVR